MKRLIGPLVIAAFAVAIWQILFAGNPGGISDARYSRYQGLRPPKLIYSCTRPPTPERLLQLKRECWDKGRSGCEEEVNTSPEARPRSEVEFAGSDGSMTYDELLKEARRNCAKPRGDFAPGTLEVLKADKG